MEGGSARKEGYLHEPYRLFHLRDTAGQERDYHFHEFDKLVILLSGRVTYEVETSAYALQPWDLLLVRHHAIHKADIDRAEPYERVILYLDGRYADRLAPGEGLTACFDRTDRPGRHRLTPDEGLRQKLAGILAAMEEARGDDGFGAKALRDALLMQLLVCVNRAVSAAPDPARTVPAVPGDRIAGILSYIGEHLDSDLSVAELAGRAYLSRYHFMRLFKEQTGLTVHAYIRRRRLLRAAERIRAGVPAGRAAAECGYEDYSAFYRAFRDCFGASPGQIR